MSEYENLPRRALTRRGAGRVALVLALLLIGVGLFARPSYTVWQDARQPRAERLEVEIRPAR